MRRNRLILLLAPPFSLVVLLMLGIVFIDSAVGRQFVKWLALLEIEAMSSIFWSATSNFKCCQKTIKLYFFRCIPAHDILQSRHRFSSEEELRDHVRDWLYLRWSEKENLLDYFYRYNNFPTTSNDPDECSFRFPKQNYCSAFLTQLAAFCTFYFLVLLFKLVLYS